MDGRSGVNDSPSALQRTPSPSLPFLLYFEGFAFGRSRLYGDLVQYRSPSLTSGPGYFCAGKYAEKDEKKGRHDDESHEESDDFDDEGRHLNLPPPEPGLPSECRPGCSVPVANQRQSHQQGRDLGLTPANQSSPACRALVQSRDKAGARRPAESKWSEEIAKTGSLRIFLALFIPTSDVRLWVSTAPKMIFSGYSPMPRLPNFLVYLIARALIRHTERRYLSSCWWGFSETCYSAHQLTRKITLL